MSFFLKNCELKYKLYIFIKKKKNAKIFILIIWSNFVEKSNVKYKKVVILVSVVNELNSNEFLTNSSKILTNQTLFGNFIGKFYLTELEFNNIKVNTNSSLTLYIF